jgi:hypothetical protein
MDLLEDVIVGRLDPEFDAGRPQVQGLLDLGAKEAIRFRLDREADASSRGGLIHILSVREGEGFETIQSIKASFDEPFLVAGLEGSEGAAKDDEIHLVCVVSDPLQRGNPSSSLQTGIVLVFGGPLGCRLGPHIGLRSPQVRTSGTKRADPVGASMGGRHHGHNRHAARRSGGLDAKQIDKSFAKGRGHAFENRQVGGESLQPVRPRDLELDPFEFVL